MSSLPSNLRARLGRTELVFGAWLFLRDPLAVEIATSAGYDYVCIDSQHGLQSFDTVTAMLAAAGGSGALPIVRVPANEAAFIGRVLDAGALGVIVPMVNTAAEAAAAVAACRYPPLGTRSLGPMAAMTRFGADYVGRANDAVTVIPMIETREGLANLDEITSVPGVDAIYVGPADLSMNLGLPPGIDQTDERFDAALGAIVSSCRAAGVIAGVHASPELVAKRADQGFQMITVGYDLNPMVVGLRGALKTAKQQKQA